MKHTRLHLMLMVAQTLLSHFPLAMESLGVQCTQYCSSGDTLSSSGGSCIGVMSVAVTYVCNDGYSSSDGGPCVASPCGGVGGGICIDKGPYVGQCASGAYHAALDCGSYSMCGTVCGGIFSGGFFCDVGGYPRCYANEPESPCPGGSLNSQQTQCTSNTAAQTVYSCTDSRYSLYPSSSNPSSCQRTYAASTITDQTTCTMYAPFTTGCTWCAHINACVTSISTPTCPTSCPAATQAACSIPISVCKWCPAAAGGIGGIGVCQPISGTCWTSCIAATADLFYADVCGYSSECRWCPQTTSVGVCQPKGGTCWTSCLEASTEPPVCIISIACKWCATNTSIGVCQPKAGTCWATCPPASSDPNGISVCSTSLSCKWCPAAAGGIGGIGVCQAVSGSCWTSCLAVTTDPRNADVCSNSSECQWCGAPGSVGYCVARTDEARIRCAASCGALIWRQDVCDSALECHWCDMHDAAEGGRCKPLSGKSRGFMAWRGEVDCNTESETRSLSDETTLSTSPTLFARSATLSDRATTTNSVSSSTSGLKTTSRSNSVSALTATRGTTPSLTVSRTLPPSMWSLSFSNTHSSSRIASMTATPSPSSTLSATLLLSMPSPSPTLALSATRYYSRVRTLVEAVSVYTALGLAIPAALGGCTTMNSLSRVVAARNVGQCWGQAGSSVFSLPIDICGGIFNKDEVQLEGQGDAVVGVALLIAGVLCSLLCWAAYAKIKGISYKESMMELSALSVLTPPWLAIIPALVGGTAVTIVAPYSTEHPLASLCSGSSGLVAVSVVLFLFLVLIPVAVIPLATQTLFHIVCVRVLIARPRETSFIARVVSGMLLTTYRRWRWEAGNDSVSRSHRIVRTLLQEYRTLWFASLDAFVVSVLSVLGSVGPLLPWSACVGTSAVVPALLGAELLVFVLSKPTTRPFDGYVCIATLSLSTVSSMLRVVYGASTTDEERDDREEMLVVAGWLDLSVSIATLVPILLDSFEVIKRVVCETTMRIDDASAAPLTKARDQDIELLPNASELDPMLIPSTDDWSGSNSLSTNDDVVVATTTVHFEFDKSSECVADNIPNHHSQDRLPSMMDNLVFGDTTTTHSTDLLTAYRDRPLDDL